MKNKILFIFLLFFQIPSNLFSSQIEFERVSPLIRPFSLKDVCLSYKKESLLIEGKGLHHISCMGEIISILDFCQKSMSKIEIGNRRLLRGYFDEKTNSAICEAGSSAVLTFHCSNKNSKFCHNPKKECQELKKIYAANLNVEMFSVIPEDEGNKLKCYFSMNKN